MPPQKQLQSTRAAHLAALKKSPRDAVRLHALALIEAQLGNHAAAREWLDKSLAIRPHNADALCHYGLVLVNLGERALAIAAFDQALALAPDHAEAAYHLALTLDKRGENDRAADAFRRTLEIKPDHVEALNSFGNLLYNQGKMVEAMGCYQRAIDANPAYHRAYSNMGLALVAVGQIDAAEAHYRKALALHPDYPEALNNLGIAYMLRERYDDSLACYDKALALRPDYPEALNNLGNVLKNLGRLPKAQTAYENALRLKEVADYRHNLGLVLLAQGDFAQGWAAYESRWHTPQLAASRRAFAQPQWRGEPAEGRTLLIHAEQGFGDTLQFCRYAPLAKAFGFRVVMEVPPALKKLLGSLSGVDQLIATGDPLPAFDLHCPMLSLPLAFATTEATIPATIPYLHPDAAAVAQWREKMPPANGKLRIGLVWAGSARMHSPDLIATNRRRSVPVELLEPLLQIPNAQFYSLQKIGQPAPASFNLIDLMQDCADFADTAALIMNLDLVISVDTAVVHLAAALGKPVWILNRFDGCWRWLCDRDDSPWYPTARLFRQTKPGDWISVINNVREALEIFPLSRIAGEGAEPLRGG